MVETISDSQRKQFEKAGWIRLSGLVSSSTLDKLESSYDGAIRQGCYGRQLTEEVFQYPGACRQRPVLFDYVTAIVGPLACQLLSCNEVQLLQDALVHKAAGCTGFIPWHQDYSYTAYLDPPATISVRLALSDETAAAGCMNVLEGSHLWPIERPLDIGAQTMDLSAADYLPKALAAHLEDSARAVELKRGEISVHHCKTIHGSQSNDTDYARKTIVTHVFDSRCVLDENRLPRGALSSHFKVDESGHLSTTLFPALHS